MYADDIKLYNISSNSMILKEYLGDILKWSRNWLLPLNKDKCNSLYLGSKNSKTAYYIAAKVYAKPDCSKDLGILVMYNLSWLCQVAKIVKKANTMLFPLSKNYSKASPTLFGKLYKTFVRPILKFANAIWAPVLQRDIALLESVQHKATRILFGDKRRSNNNLSSPVQRAVPYSTFIYNQQRSEIARTSSEVP
ncbi:hypothetical protein Zmor_011318 [Zophobas morio]|uniref:Reverse transcriptase domain-containing protein n=1 Tax=Zophobas morio TaxID=2755281 RepID=A0AA38IMJ1_9CUCU|nr:hypothetical protein Zmor_011318 [Zophobas morio]